MRFQKLLKQFSATLKAWAGRKKSRGQSLVELALFLPVLLLILSGLIEFGFGLNQYINIVEATREGARFGVDGDPGNEPFKNDPARAARDLVEVGGFLVSDTTCEDDPSTVAVEEATRDYYGQIACIVQRAADPIVLNASNSDVIITVVRTYRNAQCDNPPPPPTPTPDPNGPECRTEILPTPYGLWPYMITQVPPAPNVLSSTSPGDPTRAEQWSLFNSGEGSKFNQARIQAYLDTTPIRSQSSAGVLIVETYYNYEQLLKLPWLTLFVPEVIPFYTYTIVPLPAAEPRPTPTPTFTPSPTFTPTPIPNPVLRINAGGPTFSSWQQDTGSGGTTAFGVIWTTDADTTLSSANTINTSLAPNAGPMPVYQTARTKGSAFTYTISNLVPSQPYLVRLHFSENWNAGRAFNVSVNGTPWWPNQTVASVAGGINTAYILDVDTTADGIGQLVIQFSAGAIINGIEVVGDAPAGDCPGDPSISNWAFGQVTLQSSIPPLQPVSLSCRAVDGNTDGAFANNSVTRTNSGAQPWWQVDLGQTRTIYEVRLWNTTDAPDIARATDFYVVLSDVETFSLAAAQALAATGNAWIYHAAGEMNAGAGPTRIWVGGQDWRYVRVILAGTNALHLAEVEVSGDPLTACGPSDITNFAQGQPALVSRLGNDPCFAVEGGIVAASAGSARADGSLYNVGSNFEQGFWQVDLGSERSVGRVTLYAATDAPGVEQTNLWVLLSTEPFISSNLAEAIAQPGVTAINNPGVVSTGGTNFDTAAFTPVLTRYIRVQRGDSGSGAFLTLAEVRVEASAPTPTPTLTPTPVCLPGVVDPLTSRIQIQGSPTWSDNESLLTIQVFLLDNCGIGVTDARPVTLLTSRPVSDTITAPNPNSVQIAPGTGIYQFTVRSTTVGTSAFTATVGSLLGGTGPIVAVTGATNQGAYVCLSGTQAQGANPKQLAVTYANPSQPSSTRRLVQLQVNWQTVSGTPISNALNQVSLGNSSNVIWTGPANTPANIGLADWISVFRTIASSGSRNLLLDFANQVSPPAGSQWRYTITATWDNGFNASYCNSLPVVITLP